MSAGDNFASKTHHVKKNKYDILRHKLQITCRFPKEYDYDKGGGLARHVKKNKYDILRHKLQITCRFPKEYDYDVRGGLVANQDQLSMDQRTHGNPTQPVNIPDAPSNEQQLAVVAKSFSSPLLHKMRIAYMLNPSGSLTKNSIGNSPPSLHKMGIAYVLNPTNCSRNLPALESTGAAQTASRSLTPGTTIDNNRISPETLGVRPCLLRNISESSPALSPQHTKAPQVTVKRNRKTISKKPVRFGCPVSGCTKTFGRRSDVKVHVRGVHDKRKDNVCGYDGCAMAFAVKGSLTKHINAVHLKLKPFVCDACGEAFAERGNLNKHFRRYHAAKANKRKTDIEPFIKNEN